MCNGCSNPGYSLPRVRNGWCIPGVYLPGCEGGGVYPGYSLPVCVIGVMRRILASLCVYEGHEAHTSFPVCAGCTTVVIASLGVCRVYNGGYMPPWWVCKGY